MSSLSVELNARLDAGGVHWAARGAAVAQGHAPGDWPEALAAALAAMPRGRLRRLDRITVWLGFPHVHYAVLPWQSFRHPADCEALAQALFDEWLEGAGGELSIAVADAPYGMPRLAVAVEAALLQGLRTLLHDEGLHLAQCRPLLVVALARFAHRLRPNCTFALNEPQALTCIHRRGGQWTAVGSLPSAPGTGFHARLAALGALLGEAPPLTLVAATDAALAPPDGDGRACHWLGIVQPWGTDDARAGNPRAA